MSIFPPNMFADPTTIVVSIVCLFSVAFMVWVLVMWTLDNRRKRAKQYLRLTLRDRAFARDQFRQAEIARKVTACGGESGDSLECTKNISACIKITQKSKAPKVEVSGQETETALKAKWRWVIMILLVAASRLPAQAVDSSDEIQELKALVQQLQTRVSQLETQRTGKDDSHVPTNTAVAQSTNADSTALAEEDRKALDFLHDTTLNFTFDGYYGYNFNHPVGRVNLLRAYDVSSNSFSISQATVILEQAPDPSKGRRFGARLDLQYGQATETLQGNAANEPRPQAYRPLFQAYGTYVAPVLKVLTMDFGKWASAMGYENNYNKDQFNYSRSFLFNFLPFYHMGFRNTLAVNDKLSIGYWLINGVQQTEDFNGFKSQVFQVVVKPGKAMQWNVIYHVGREQRDLVPLLNPGLPALPTQPGLSTAPVFPTPDGRFHLLDSYASWSVTPKLTLVGEGDYVISRRFEHSIPAHVIGGAAYAHYQFTPKVALTCRTEYLSDRGGLFSGVTQALKETTLTYEYKIADGLVSRLEWRRDFSNHPFFLTETPGVFKQDQNTATLGMIWWWGGKQGSW
jgi:Sec-independent protein translocase protein TatA